jgi:hypothetical protein
MQWELWAKERSIMEQDISPSPSDGAIDSRDDLVSKKYGVTREVEKIFDEFNFSHYLDKFHEEGFDTLEAIFQMTESDFAALGVKLGHRRLLQKRISEALKETNPSASPVLSSHKRKKKAPMISFSGSSSDEEGLSRGNMPAAVSHQNVKPGTLKCLLQRERQMPFSRDVTTRLSMRMYDDDVIEADESDDEDGSGDDEDSSEWEDSIEDSGGGGDSIDENTFFQRVDSRLDLISRRSLITLMLHQDEYVKEISEKWESIPAWAKKLFGTSPQNITSVAHPLHSDVDKAVLKRRHTTSDVKNSKEYPEQMSLGEEDNKEA